MHLYTSLALKDLFALDTLPILGASCRDIRLRLLLLLDSLQLKKGCFQRLNFLPIFFSLFLKNLNFSFLRLNHEVFNSLLSGICEAGPY